MAKQVKQPVFRVGLLGESPNDTRAVAALLGRRYGERVEFFNLVERLTGDMLEGAGAFRQLRREYEYERPKLVIVIRDLDGLETDYAQVRKRRGYFRRVDRQVEGRALLLLNIYSIEALIAADIAAFNGHYDGCQCVIEADVMTIVKPIELLTAASAGRYREGHCADILAKADYETLVANCRYFRQFETDFAAQLPPSS